MSEKWDGFLSYASEDREAVAEPLARMLMSLGARIWFDRTELKIGDSLRERIDDGLAHSRFGIVVLSPAFFAKHYPLRELNGLAQREVEGSKVILPVWYNIDAATIRAHSPPLADRIAAKWENGKEKVASELFCILRPDIVADMVSGAKNVRDLPGIVNGRELFDIMANAHAHQFFTDDVNTEEEAALVGEFQSGISEIADFAEDMSHVDRLRMHLSLGEEIANLNSTGWQVFGERQRRKVKLGTAHSSWEVAVVCVLKGARKVAMIDSEKLLVARKEPIATSSTE